MLSPAAVPLGTPGGGPASSVHHKGAHGTGTYHQHSGELPGAGGAVLPPPSTLPRTGEYGPGEFVPGGFYGGLIGDGAADRPPTAVQVGALSDLCSATPSRASNDHAAQRLRGGAHARAVPIRSRTTRTDLQRSPPPAPLRPPRRPRGPSGPEGRPRRRRRPSEGARAGRQKLKRCPAAHSSVLPAMPPCGAFLKRSQGHGARGSSRELSCARALLTGRRLG